MGIELPVLAVRVVDQGEWKRRQSRSKWAIVRPACRFSEVQREKLFREHVPLALIRKKARLMSPTSTNKLRIKLSDVN